MKRIIAYKGYYKSFMETLAREEQLKIRRALLLLQTDDKVPQHYIKYLTGGIWELRVTLPNKEARLFFFYDEGNLVVLMNCIIKKTQKTPYSEIEKAKHLKAQYYAEK
jgi:phage-related protein